jgi:hypothetical protein
VKKNQTQDPVINRRLRAVVRRYTDENPERGCPVVIGFDTIPALLAQEKDLSPLQQMERYIQLAADAADFFGARSQFDNPLALANRLCLGDVDNEKAERFMRPMQRAGLLERIGTGFDCELTVDGWQLAERIRTTKKVGDQAFVAMWFHRGMDAVYAEGLEPALRSCGYIPYRVDRAAHQNKIDDEIIANIRKSRLIVADLTGVRPNVFYEAGFAHGLGIDFVLTCNDSWAGHFVAAEPNGESPPSPSSAPWFQQVSDHAFDIRNYTVLGWSTPSDLAEKLALRIRALALDLK